MEGNRPLVAPLLWLLLAVLWAVPPDVYPLSAAATPVLVLFLGGLLLFAGGWRPGRERGWLLAACALPLLVSHVFALDSGAAVDTWVRLTGVLVVFLAARSLSTAERLATLRLLALGGGVLAAYGLWQYFFGFERLLALPALDPAVAGRLATYRVFARFPLPSVFASFLLLAWPAAAGLVLARRGGARWVTGAATVLIAVALLLTQSQGAFVALAGAALCWAALSPRRLIRRGAAALAAAAAIAFVVVIAARSGTLFADSEAAGPAALRWRNWSAAARMTLDHPVTGVGGDGFGSAYTAYRRTGDNETRYAHNVVLQMTAEHGLPVLIPLGVLGGLLAGRVRRAAHSGTRWEAGAAFGVTAFALHNLLDFSALLTGTSWTAAAVVGVMVARREQSVADAVSAPARQVPARAPRVAMALVAVVLVGVVVAGIGNGLARRQLDLARQSALAGRLDAAIGQATWAERLAPWRAEAPLFQAEARLDRGAAGDVQAALDAADRAVSANRAWAAARRVRAVALAAAGDASGAARDLERATTLYPLSEAYRRELEQFGTQLAGAREESR